MTTDTTVFLNATTYFNFIDFLQIGNQDIATAVKAVASLDGGGNPPLQKPPTAGKLFRFGGRLYDLIQEGLPLPLIAAKNEIGDLARLFKKPPRPEPERSKAYVEERLDINGLTHKEVLEFYRLMADQQVLVECLGNFRENSQAWKRRTEILEQTDLCYNLEVRNYGSLFRNDPKVPGNFLSETEGKIDYGLHKLKEAIWLAKYESSTVSFGS